jgi:hypothetical protein
MITVRAGTCAPSSMVTAYGWRPQAMAVAPFADRHLGAELLRLRVARAVNTSPEMPVGNPR